MPEASEAKMAASIAPIFSERPINGDGKRTWKASAITSDAGAYRTL
jgi:hypothetical protein